MVVFKIAFRNIVRNRRRSVMTGAAIAVGAVAILLLGSFFARSILGLQTLTVERTGHLSVFRNGYFEFGNGNPGGYSVPTYRAVMALIRNDAVAGPMINVVTPIVQLFGIAGNFDLDASKSFFGEGFVPADRDRMMLWDEYNIADEFWRSLMRRGSGLSDDDPAQGVVGLGLARILGLCEPLKLADCPKLIPTADEEEADTNSIANKDFTDLIGRDPELATPETRSDTPRLDLLGATAGGAPNVVTLHVARADFMGLKELDDNFVGMHLSLAQQLLYGRREHQVTGIVLQLHRTEDLGAVKRRLADLFREHRLPLELHDFTELTPMYNQAIAMYVVIFAFIGTVMGVIVLFTVVNTMSMSVMERINEIGTSRAIGLRRSGVRRQFLVEGWLLGTLGATVGVFLAVATAHLFNSAGFTWTPPTAAGEVPLQLMISAVWVLAVPTWIMLIAIATVAAVIPANRAARMPVVDALRHA